MEKWLKKIENIIVKIKQKRKDFSKEEIVIIQNDKKLSILFLENLNTSSTRISKDYQTLIFSSLQNTQNSQITKSTFEKALYFFEKVSLITDPYYPNSLESMAFYFGANKDFVEKIKDLEAQAFQNPDEYFDIENLYVTESLICKLLDYKKYDFLERIKSETYLSKETYERLKTEHPNFNKLTIIKEYERENNITEENSLLELLYIHQSLLSEIENFILNNPKSNIPKELETKKNTLKEIIIKKIKNRKDCNDLTKEKIVSNFLEELNAKEKQEVQKLLYERDNLSYVNELLEAKLISIEDLQQKVKECIIDHKQIPSFILEKLSLNPFENEDIIKSLIDYEYLEYLIEKEKLTNNEGKLKKYIPYIVNKIKENGPYYQSISSAIKDTIFNSYPEILDAIISTGKLSDIKLTKRDCLTKSLYPTLLKAIQQNENINLIINKFVVIPEDFIQFLIENECCEIVFTNKRIKASMSNELIMKNINNLYFSDTLIRLNYQNIRVNKQIVQSLLENPILYNLLLKRISTDDQAYSLDLYNEENFTIVKKHFIQKYQLNPNHLEKLEKVTGPQIIKYIEDKNIQNIINLEEKDFQKLITLFPKLDYTKKDLEAVDESLTQYIYNRNNPEDANIFSHFVQAIKSQNRKEIKKLIEKFIIYMPNDYHIQIHDNSLTIIEFLKQMEKNIENEYYLNKLGDLAYEYVVNSRNRYCKNHRLFELHPEYANLLERLLKSIDNKNELEENKLIKEINTYIKPDFYKKLNSIENLEDLLHKIKNPKTRDKYLPFLSIIINKYYEIINQKYKKETSIESKLNISYSLDKNSKENEIIKYLIIHSEYIFTKNGNTIQEEIIKQLKGNLNSWAIKSYIEYYNPQKRYLFNSATINEKELKQVIEAAIFYIKTNYNQLLIEEDKIVEELNQENKIKRNYKILSEKSNILPILANLNLEPIKETIFKEEKIYQKLYFIMNKYKLHLLPNTLKTLLKECEISDDYTNVASFINCFKSILENEEKRLMSENKNPETALTSFATIATCMDNYSCNSNIYCQILGTENARLIRSNPKPNEAERKTDKGERLEEAIQLTISNYKRRKITVPAFQTEISLNKKTITAIVGNFTDPSNLTHGERTSSCMRIGGTGETLFYFCLKNPNGFHIRFENPKTQEYISRVSGFRNGNTVFLNQLRNSCNKEEYSDDDLQIACQEVAKELIEKTKNSSCRIENVIISTRYAMTNSKKEPIFLNINNNKEGLPAFYSDIESIGIVLATTATDKPFMPINFNKENVPTYETYRPKPRIITSPKKIIEKISRIQALKHLIENGKYNTPIKNLDNIESLIATDDWYLYIDKNNKIHSACIEIDPRARIELDENLTKIKAIIQEEGEKKHV